MKEKKKRAKGVERVNSAVTVTHKGDPTNIKTYNITGGHCLQHSSLFLSTGSPDMAIPLQTVWFSLSIKTKTENKKTKPKKL